DVDVVGAELLDLIDDRLAEAVEHRGDGDDEQHADEHAEHREERAEAMRQQRLEREAHVLGDGEDQRAHRGPPRHDRNGPTEPCPAGPEALRAAMTCWLPTPSATSCRPTRFSGRERMGYSERSASIGSRRAARRAGWMPKNTPIAVQIRNAVGGAHAG